jgi:hypothetical protein
MPTSGRRRHEGCTNAEIVKSVYISVILVRVSGEREKNSLLLSFFGAEEKEGKNERERKIARLLRHIYLAHLRSGKKSYAEWLMA